MTTLPGWSLDYQGKVRDIYIPENASKENPPVLLMVASDRVSALDVILAPEIPGKGATLTEVSGWWMAQFPDIPNHLVQGEVPAAVQGRAVLAKPLHMLPVECVVRGYLVGSGWSEYASTHTVCGIELPTGLNEGDPLPEPIFTPATKAAVGDHDINIDFDGVVERIGAHAAEAIRSLSLTIYARASEIARAKGLILADTKFEFGLDPDTGAVVWADEALTPDSSRYWDADTYRAGGPDRLSSFDKQPIRDWLKANWSGEGTPPALPDHVVVDTQKRYADLLGRVVGVGL
jgi:phosphoribosylaminoimidazole-succinocarboxamide synthase